MNDREQSIRAVAASATDLANSWARESGVEEARDELGLVRVIDGLWNNWSEKYFSIQRERDELAAHVERLTKALREATGYVQLAFDPDACRDFKDFNKILAATPAVSLKAHDAALMKPLIQMAIDRGWHDFPEDWQS